MARAPERVRVHFFGSGLVFWGEQRRRSTVVGRPLEIERHAEQHTFLPGTSEQLEAYRHPVIGESSGQADGGQS